MPEIIDLLSSPTQPTDKPQSPYLEAQPDPIPIAAYSSPRLPSAEFDFLFDDLDKPSKRRRLSPGVTTENGTRSQTQNISLFDLSDDDDLIFASSNPGEVGAATRTFTWDGEDPVTFAFSTPEPTTSRSEQKISNVERGIPTTITIDDDDDDIGNFSDPFISPDDVLDSILETRALKGKELSNRTANLLASLGNRTKTQSEPISRVTPPGSQLDKKKKKAGDHNPVFSDEINEIAEYQMPKRKKQAKTSNADKEVKAREQDAKAKEREAKTKDREAAKAQRERLKEEEKERKRKEKEDKAKEKQLMADLAEVNKLKINKNQSTSEMIVDLSSSFLDTSVGNQVAEFMNRLEVEHKFFNSSIPNIVKWRRKVRAIYNENVGHWEPCDPRVLQEDHVLCLLSAPEFVDMVVSPVGSDGDALELYILKLKSAYPGCKQIYLIEGLEAWMRKNKNSRNRAYQAEVLRQMTGFNEPSQSQTSRQPGRRTKNPETSPLVDDDVVEDALLQLQVTHSCLIHHTVSTVESAEWIKNFTEHISTIPYRKERMDLNDSAFCMERGQVKHGEDAADTYVKMLQEINRVTASMAYGIAATYPSVRDLIRGMRKYGPLMLEDVKKATNKNGALSDGRIGPAASKRLYKVFMGLDPASTDV